MNSDNSGKAVGLLGGSFDPVHNGHVSIARSFLKSNYISKLWILLTPEPPHKPEQVFCDYEHRLNMLKAAFGRIDAVEVKETEKNLPRPSYTIQTLKYLAKEYPDYNFYLCLGEDSIYSFKKWKDWKQILEFCELLVVGRQSTEDLALDPVIAEKTHLVDHRPIEISSTEVRNRVAEGKDISDLVPKTVNKIIQKENLYLQD